MSSKEIAEKRGAAPAAAVVDLSIILVILGLPIFGEMMTTQFFKELGEAEAEGGGGHGHP